MAIGGVVINFTARTAKAVQDVSKFTKELGKVDGAANKTGKVLKKGLAIGAAAAGAALLGAGAAAIKFAESAIDDADSAAKLAKALKNTTKATDAQVDSLEDWISQQGIAYGFADDKLRPAITRLARSTKDLTEAQELTTLAMDISAATGKDLETVANALAKANDGQIGALKKLGLTLGNNAENAIEYNKAQTKMSTLMGQAATALQEYGPKSKEYLRAQEKVADQQKIINGLAEDGIDWQAELGAAMEGSAATAAGTVKGTWERVKLIFQEVGEAIGEGALPLLSKLGDWFKEKKNQKAVQDFIDKVSDLSVALGEDLAQALSDVYAWFNSAEGRKALDNFGKSLQTVVDAVKALGSAFAALGRAYDKLPDWFKKLQGKAFEFLGNVSLPGAISKIAGPEPTPVPTPKNVKITSPSSPQVVVNNYYPRPETASANLAASLRMARLAGAS